MLGYQRYLLLFANFKIGTLRTDSKEKDFFHFMAEIQKEGDILDIGANIGIMTAHLSKKFTRRKIHAFEPEPTNVEVLQRIIEKKSLKNVVVYPIALGAEDTMIEMVLPHNGKVKMQGLSHVVHPTIQEWNEGDTFRVECKKLDHLDLPKISGIKMDVENFEFYVLQGAAKLIERDHPVIYLELWENENRDKCFTFLKELSYQPFVVVENTLVPYDSLEHHKQNFIFK